MDTTSRDNFIDGINAFMKVDWVYGARQISEYVAALEERAKVFPEEIRTIIAALAQKGWFLAPDIFSLDDYHHFYALSFKNQSTLDQELIAIYAGKIDDVKEEISRAFPQRAKILLKAFGAHERGDYELSIPVMLAQIDGMCFDVFSKHFFQQRAQLNDKVEQEGGQRGDDDLLYIIAKPLCGNFPLVMNEGQRKLNSVAPNELNRHAVLHGENLFYGTETNSLKVISLLSVVRFIDDDLNGHRSS